MRRSLFLIAVVVVSVGTSGCAALRTDGDDFLRTLSRFVAQHGGQTTNEPAVAQKMRELFAPVSDLSDEAKQQLLDSACDAKNRFDLSNVNSMQNAADWVAGQSKLPANRARAFLNELKQLRDDPSYSGAGAVTVDAVCAFNP